MRALSLDFQRKTLNAKLGYGLVVFGGLIAALVVAAQVMIYQEIERHSAPAPDTGRARGERVLPRGVVSQAEALAGARMVVGHLAGPGEELFRALEAIQEPDVALLALTPDTQKRVLRVYAEARNFEAMVAYTRALEQSRVFRQVMLVEHEIQSKDPQQPLRFSLAAAWGQ